MLETSQDLCWGWVGGSKVMWLSPLQRSLKKKRTEMCGPKTSMGLIFLPISNPLVKQRVLC